MLCDCTQQPCKQVQVEAVKLYRSLQLRLTSCSAAGNCAPPQLRSEYMYAVAQCLVRGSQAVRTHCLSEGQAKPIEPCDTRLETASSFGS